MFTIFLYFALLYTALGQSYDFGGAFLSNSALCGPWACVNRNLGFPETLPPKDQLIAKLQSHVPEGPWQNIVSQAAEKCYREKPRSYINNCLGQQVLHCVVDQMINLCPEDSLKHGLSCTPVASVYAHKYLFVQDEYKLKDDDDEMIKRDYSSKCCNLPELIEQSFIKSCGFKGMMKISDNGNLADDFMYSNLKDYVDKSLIVEPKNVIITKIEDIKEEKDQDIDILECCSLSGFIDPSWRSECGFEINFDERNRLTIKNQTVPVVTTTAVPSTTSKPKFNDVKIVPQSCEKETCVFRNLNIISESGSIDTDAYSKLLDNVTNGHPSWSKAKARVVTKCLSKPITDYIDDCEINKVLACTFDILSENCPHAPKNDACKHTTSSTKSLTCQISSSKLRPKNRRQYCGLPSLVSHDVLAQCGLSSLSRTEFVPVATPTPRTQWWNKQPMICEALTESSKCLLEKMGVLNKYGFLDYFKMKEKIRVYTSTKPEWTAKTDVLLSTFTASPMYAHQCSSSKKLLNLLDAMTRTCPLSRQKFDQQCHRILTNMKSTAPADSITLSRLPLGLSRIDSMPPIYRGNVQRPVIRRTPNYNFGILYSNVAPKVETIDIRKPTTYKPTVLLPVYMRTQNTGTGSYSVKPDGVRSAPAHPAMPVNLDMTN